MTIVDHFYNEIGVNNYIIALNKVSQLNFPPCILLSISWAM